MNLPPFSQNSKSSRIWLLILLILNTAVILISYFILVNMFQYAFLFYYGALAILALTYVIYNRGFAADRVTPEMFPPDTSLVKIQEFFEKRDRRKQASKWMLTLIIPLVFTFLIDVIILFFGDAILSFWNQLTGGGAS